MNLSLTKLIDLLKRNNYKIKKIYCEKNKCLYITLSHSKDLYRTTFTLDTKPYSISCKDHPKKKCITLSEKDFTNHLDMWKTLNSNFSEKTLLFISKDKLSVINSSSCCNSYNILEENIDEDDSVIEQEQPKDIVKQAEDVFLNIERGTRKRKVKSSNIIFVDENDVPVFFKEEVLGDLGKDEEESEIFSNNSDEDLYDIDEFSIENIDCHVVFPIDYIYDNIKKLHKKIKIYNAKIYNMEKDVFENNIYEVISNLKQTRIIVEKKYHSYNRKLERLDKRISNVEETVRKANELIDKDGINVHQLKKLKEIIINANKKLNEYFKRKGKIFKDINKLIAVPTKFSEYMTEHYSL